MKLKILGIALLALAATSTFAATNASATAAGHFIHHGPTNNAIITAHESAGTPHILKFFRLNVGTLETSGVEAIQCKTSQYTGTVSAKTVTSVQLYPKYTECTTGDGTILTVHPNGCSYTFSSQGTRKHATFQIDCEAGKAIEITHPSCTTKVPAQTIGSPLIDGVSYHNVLENDIPSLTATVTVKAITVHLESGPCIFFGTNQNYEMIGAVKVTGFEDLGGSAKEHTLLEGKQIAITST